MTAPFQDHHGTYHPRDEAEVQWVIRHARSLGRKVRVRGAGHSHPPSIGLGAGNSGPLAMTLDRMRAVSFDDARMQVTAQAGCNLGVDMRDATGRSTEANSLCSQLEARGWALANLGGIAHQTVAGMILTGSCGGSVKHDLYQQLIGVRIVDGRGNLHALSWADGERFAAAGVSMGLLGVIVSVTFQCELRYDIHGSLSAFRFDDAPFDMTGTGPDSLEAYLREAPYARLEWWPQQGLDRVVLWDAQRMAPEDYSHGAGQPGALIRKRFIPFKEIFETSVPVQAAGGAFLSLASWWNKREQAIARSGLKKNAMRWSISKLYEGFVLSPGGASVPFRDAWFPGLSMDDSLDDRVLPMSFGEIWLPLEHTGEALRRLRSAYGDGGSAAQNLMACEIYAAGPSPFLMSQGHGRASVRLNWYWYDRQKADVAAWMEEKYRLLEDLSPRLHWGKVLPRDPTWVGRVVRPTLPGWDAFEAQRRALDPDDLFLSPYWANHLGLTRSSVPTLHRDVPPAGRHRPTVFRCRPPSGGGGVHFSTILPIHAERVSQLVADLTNLPLWWPDIRRIMFLSGDGLADDAVVLAVGPGGNATRMSVSRTDDGWTLTANASSTPNLVTERLSVRLEAESPGYTQVSLTLLRQRRVPLRPTPQAHHLERSIHQLERCLHRAHQPQSRSATVSTLPQRIQAFMIALGTDREASLLQMDSLFTPDICYQDPLRKASNRQEFHEIFMRMFRKYRMVNFTDFRISGNEAAFTVEYTMQLQMAVGPVFSLPMVTICRTRDGKISEYIDYFDMISALLSPAPRTQSIYHRAMVRAFL